jgi:long-chain acyl-CoA synthetase
VNLSQMLLSSVARAAGKPALYFRDRPISYGQLEEAVARTAGALAAAGVEPGDRVAIVAGNVPEFVYALHGTWRAGAVAVPLNVMLTSEELSAILADCGARALVCEMGYLPVLLSVRDDLKALETIMVIAGPPVPHGTVSFEEALGTAGPSPEVERGDDELALIQYTSGTTANPKGAMLTHGNLLANIEQMQRVPALAQAEHDVVLLVLPLFHIYGLNVGLNLTLAVAGTGVLVERFDPLGSLDQIREHGVTVLPGAPPMYHAWLEADPPRASFNSVRLAVSGAAALPAEVMEGVRARFGMTIWEGYGLTEAAPAVSSNAVGSEAKPASVGLPLPGVEVRLLDVDGTEADDGDPGEIVVRGPNVFGGYWQRPEESDEILRGEWLHTGDVAYRDDDGYLFIVDRTKDLVIVSGFNVYPKEVEEALLLHPEIEDAAVVGVPDPRTGEAVKAFVVAAPGSELTAETVVAHVGAHLARFKVPREVEIVDELPRHPTGKVLRRYLREEPKPRDELEGEE